MCWFELVSNAFCADEMLEDTKYLEESLHYRGKKSIQLHTFPEVTMASGGQLSR